MILKKDDSLNSIKMIFEGKPFIAVYQQNGLDASETISLHQFAIKNKLKIKTVKNTTVKVVLKNTNYTHFCNLFEGPCMMVYSPHKHDKVSSIFQLNKTFHKLVPLGAIIENEFISSKEFEWVSNINDFNDFYISIAHMCLIPCYHFVSSLNSSTCNISYILQNNTVK